MIRGETFTWHCKHCRSSETLDDLDDAYRAARHHTITCHGVHDYAPTIEHQEGAAMIPDHLIDQAWHAYVWSSNQQAIRNEMAYPDLRGPMPPPPDPRQSLLAALEAVAAEIWEDGYEEGAGDEHAINGADKRGEKWPPLTPNPYKASEDA